jgi:NAD+ kinase
MKSLPKLVIFGDPKKQGVSEAVERFIGFAKDKADIIGNYSIEQLEFSCHDGLASVNIETSDSSDKSESKKVLPGCDYAVVFGGVGSIIATARAVSEANVPVIGVNVGKLGFLAEFSVDELQDFFPHLTNGTAHVDKRMMLKCSVFSTVKGQQQTEKFCSEAINDVFITAGPPFRTIELKILVDSQPLAGCISDGLIISTPTGSTAYNLSAGGPIISPKMDAIAITPICPHSLSFRPIIISASSTVEVVGVKVNEGTTISIDGQISLKLGTDNIVNVQKHDRDFFIVNNPLRNKWDTLATKLRWAEKPKYNRS